jgi:hypothetical protein
MTASHAAAERILVIDRALTARFTGGLRRIVRNRALL